VAVLRAGVIPPDPLPHTTPAVDGVKWITNGLKTTLRADSEPMPEGWFFGKHEQRAGSSSKKRASLLKPVILRASYRVSTM
jgi:hypothetical protein